MKRVLFIAAGPITWASARYRAFWIAEKMGADCMTLDDVRRHKVDMSAYSHIVWQKSVDIQAMKELRDAGVSNWLDTCDPIHWFQPELFRQAAELCDGIVTPTAALANDIAEFVDARMEIIPDRLDLAHYPIQRTHTEASPLRLIWFGLYANRMSMFGALSAIERLHCNGYKIELTICDERPDVYAGIGSEYPVYHVQWKVDKENAIISAHDVAILPPYPGEWGRLKSNNKHLTAWACGVPVATCDSYKDLLRLTSWEQRAMDAKENYDILKWHYNIQASANEWKAVLDV